jgi:hypothetical protein
MNMYNKTRKLAGLVFLAARWLDQIRGQINELPKLYPKVVHTLSKDTVFLSFRFSEIYMLHN